MNLSVSEALDHFIDKYLVASVKSGKKLEIEYDPDWPSDCYLKQQNSDELIEWHPCLRKERPDFSGFERALELTIHPDLKEFYARYWSDNLNAKSEKGSLQLLQAWNADDFERLQQNLVGHVLMKRRLKQPETLFFAVTELEDFILTIDNTTGEVLLEQVGLPASDTLAASLAEFIHSIEPDFS